LLFSKDSIAMSMSASIEQSSEYGTGLDEGSENSSALAIGLGVTFGLLGLVAIADAVLWVGRKNGDGKDEDEKSQETDQDELSASEI
jgi:hypothetical protein